MKTRYVKREEAWHRQKRYNDLSNKQRLDLILSRRGDSKKETLRLMVAVDKKKGQQHGNANNKAAQKGQ